MDVTSASQDKDQTALKAALLRCAKGLTNDPAEAQALVARTLATVEDPAGTPAAMGETQLFRLLRQTYHSIERTRTRRPMRDALVTSLARSSEAARSDQGG